MAPMQMRKMAIMYMSDMLGVLSTWTVFTDPGVKVAPRQPLALEDPLAQTYPSADLLVSPRPADWGPAGPHLWTTDSPRTFSRA